MTAGVLVVYHSRKGTQHALATAAADGARSRGAAVRLRQLADGDLPVSGEPPTAEDLLWADGIVWGTPTYYGNVSAPVKRFIDSTSDLWRAGLLADRVVAGLTSSTSLNGGQEATLLALYRSMYHWGAVVVSGDSTLPGWAETGGNPYGVSVCANAGNLPDLVRAAAANAGARVADLAGRTRVLRVPAPVPDTGTRPPRIAVVYQNGQPSLNLLAMAVAEGARAGGASVRVRRIDPLLAADVPEPVPPASAADIAWADGVAWGISATTGTLPAALSHFIETTQETLPAGDLRGKTTTAFAATPNAHTGGESTLLSAYVAMHNWDAVVVAPGYTDPTVSAAGGNPYGTLVHMRNGPRLSAVLAAARHQGRRLSLLTAVMTDIGEQTDAGSWAHHGHR